MKKVSLLLMFVLISLFGFFANASENIQEDVPGAATEPAPDMTTGIAPQCAREDQSCYKNLSPQLLESGSAHANRARAQRALGITAEATDSNSGKPVNN